MAAAILWHRACEILHLPEDERGAGWPESFNIERIARLHYPDDKPMEHALLSLLKAAVADGGLCSNGTEHVITRAAYMSPEKAEFHNALAIYSGTSERYQGGTKTWGHDVSTVTREGYEQWQERPPFPENSPLRGWIAAGGGVAPKTDAPAKRSRKTNITRAVEAARNALHEKSSKEPSADEVYAFLEDGDETGHIVDWTEDAVTWRDTKGNFHDTTKKSVTNLLSRMRRTD